jgi:hypothetical protein
MVLLQKLKRLPRRVRGRGRDGRVSEIVIIHLAFSKKKLESIYKSDG